MFLVKRFRSTLPARLPGAEPYRMIQSVSRDGMRPATGIYVTPPVPADFDDGQCAGASEEDRERFFITETLGKEASQTAVERDYLWARYCAACPIKIKCFEWGMAYEDWGIWAGTTEFDRKRARAKTDEGRALLEFGHNRIKAGYQPYYRKEQ